MAKFLFLGDSLTYGYDVTPGYGWVELLQAYCFNKQKNISVINAGVNGDTLQGMLNRLSRTEDEALYANLCGDSHGECF